jgi:hypothetical protein
MDAAADQEARGATTTPGLPFKRVVDTWTPRAYIAEGSDYGLAWVLTELPGKLGLTGVNGYECPSLPIVAQGTERQPLVYHQGSVSGSLSAVYLLPKTHKAVVVLGNSFDLSDTPDWISQLILEALLDSPERNDFVKLAKITAANALSHHQPTIDRLAAEKEEGTTYLPLEKYCGRYYNKLGNYFLEFPEVDGGLLMAQHVDES